MATTYTLPDGSLLTKPAYADTADVNVINTSMQNMANNITELNRCVYSGTLANNTDLNTVTDVGTYFLNSSNTYTNKPNDTVYVLNVFKSSNSATTLLQQAWNTKFCYTRFRTSATAWSAWTSENDLHGIGINKMNLIPQNADLNNYTTPGSYLCTTSTIGGTVSNSPVANTGFSLICESCSGSAGQYIFQTFKSLAASLPITYERVYTGSTWIPWRKLAIDDNIKMILTSNAYDAVSVPNNTDTTLCSFTCPTSGVYLIVVTASWNANATGYRVAWLSETEAGVQLNVSAKTIVAAVPGGEQTRHQVVYPTQLSASKTYYVVGKQNSGSSLSVSPRVSLMQIK